MAKKNVEISEYELAALQVLWDRGSATIRQITEEIYGETTNVKYATVQKLLERLENKKCVRRSRKSFAHNFSPLIDRSELINHSLEKLAQRLCDGSLMPLLIHLAGNTRLTDSQRKTLHKLIDDSG
jgi:BlaI family penicillinase repressor